MIDLKEIKLMRKRFNLTQKELADKAGVSQSLIAKVEAGTIDPTYTKAMKIISAIDNITDKKELRAEELMNPSVISVTPETKLKEAANRMRKHEISQMPVLRDGNMVGMISESIIIEAISDEKKKDALVRDIMKDPPPIIAKDTKQSVVSQLLKSYPILIVAQKGRIIGVIARSDIIKKIYQ